MKKALLFLIMALVLGCSSSKETTETKVEEPQKVNGIEVREVLEVESFNDFHVSKDFTIISSMIHDDILEVEISYSGGCAEHYFFLYTTLEYMKSLPPKLNLFLVHDANGDVCRELIQETLLFDIKKLQYEAQSKVQLVLNTEYLVEYNY